MMRWTIIVGVISLIVGAVIGRYTASSPQLVTEVTRVTIYDTVRVDAPQVRDSVVVRWVERPLPEVATRDTVLVEVPITRYVYADSTYTAYVSGYEARLDSLTLCVPTTVVTRVTREQPSRWSIGVMGGVGAGTRGISPMVGVGVCYRLF